MHWCIGIAVLQESVAKRCEERMSECRSFAMSSRVWCTHVIHVSCIFWNQFRLDGIIWMALFGWHYLDGIIWMAFESMISMCPSFFVVISFTPRSGPCQAAGSIWSREFHFLLQVPLRSTRGHRLRQQSLNHGAAEDEMIENISKYESVSNAQVNAGHIVFDMWELDLQCQFLSKKQRQKPMSARYCAPIESVLLPTKSMSLIFSWNSKLSTERSGSYRLWKAPRPAISSSTAYAVKFATSQHSVPNLIIPSTTGWVYSIL